MRTVPKSRVVWLGISVWKGCPIRPLLTFTAIAGSIFGKYLLISCWTFEFKSRDGIITNWVPSPVQFGQPTQYVSAALSAGVKVTPDVEGRMLGLESKGE